MVLQRHWEDRYRRTPFDQVGWWEESPEASLRLVDRCVLAPDDLIVDAGAGSSTVIERATECSDLSVRNYDAAMLGEFLGPEFALIETFDHTYTNPSGSPRPYVYALFQR